MRQPLELLYFTAAILGLLIGCALLLQLFRRQPAPFFLGLIVLVLATELLFSWGAQSGYNNQPNAFPIWILLNYQLLPPALWLFVRYQTDKAFHFQHWHLLLFLPAAIETLAIVIARSYGFPLSQLAAWRWLEDHLPLAGCLAVLGYFWFLYVSTKKPKTSKNNNGPFELRLLVLMGSLTLIGLCWLVFTFIGWQYFRLIELTLSFTFFAFAFLSFLEPPSFGVRAAKTKPTDFPEYEDQSELVRLERTLREHQLYLQPKLSLQEVAVQLNRPSRYVSYLINHYHGKQFKEYLNSFRLETFLIKARSPEAQYKTLLAIALESGFNSKSTFNQVFKSKYGQSPSVYLKAERRKEP